MVRPRIKVNHKQHIAVVELLDEEILDEITIGEITDDLFSVIEENAGGRILLNFEQVVHMSSNMLGTLIRLNKHCEEGGGTLKLCGIQPNLREMFVITKVNKLFEMYDTEEAALLSFSA
ncbi:MAG: STAS domain-containing protein [Sedimentisphaerales bacterium]|nr:STAS domain-containing protein [Sedimentisphaerales bacterium]